MYNTFIKQTNKMRMIGKNDIHYKEYTMIILNNKKT